MSGWLALGPFDSLGCVGKYVHVVVCFPFLVYCVNLELLEDHDPSGKDSCWFWFVEEPFEGCMVCDQGEASFKEVVFVVLKSPDNGKAF